MVVKARTDRLINYLMQSPRAPRSMRMALPRPAVPAAPRDALAEKQEPRKASCVGQGKNTLQLKEVRTRHVQVHWWHRRYHFPDRPAGCDRHPVADIL